MFSLGAYLLLAGCHRGDPAAGSEASTSTNPVPVKCVRAAVTTLHPSIEVVGTLVSVPERTVSLSTQIAGQIQSIGIVEGQRVHSGQELLRLDDRSAAAQRGKAAAVVDENRAIVARLRKGFRPEEIDTARQELRRAESNLQLARTRLESASKLRESHVIPDLEFEQRKSAVEAAAADSAAAQAKLKLLELGPRPEEVAEAEARLAGATADLASSDLALQLTHVSAPIDGVVTDLAVRQGMFVSPGTTFLTLVDTSTLYTRTRVPTAYWGQVKQGAKVDIRVASIPDETMPGSIARIGVQADLQTGDVESFAAVPNPKGRLCPGLACRLRIWLPEISAVLVVPTNAISDHDGKPVVTVVRDNKAHEIEVGLGGRTEGLIQITSGLADGDLVAVEGGYGLPDGSACTVFLESPPNASSQAANPSP